MFFQQLAVVMFGFWMAFAATWLSVGYLGAAMVARADPFNNIDRIFLFGSLTFLGPVGFLLGVLYAVLGAQWRALYRPLLTWPWHKHKAA